MVFLFWLIVRLVVTKRNEALEFGCCCRRYRWVTTICDESYFYTPTRDGFPWCMLENVAVHTLSQAIIHSLDVLCSARTWDDAQCHRFTTRLFNNHKLPIAKRTTCLWTIWLVRTEHRPSYRRTHPTGCLPTMWVLGWIHFNSAAQVEIICTCPASWRTIVSAMMRTSSTVICECGAIGPCPVPRSPRTDLLLLPFPTNKGAPRSDCP